MHNLSHHPHPLDLCICDTWWTCVDTSYHPKFIVYIKVHSILVMYILWVFHNSIIQNSFTALKILCKMHVFFNTVSKGSWPLEAQSWPQIQNLGCKRIRISTPPLFGITLSFPLNTGPHQRLLLKWQAGADLASTLRTCVALQGVEADSYLLGQRRSEPPGQRAFLCSARPSSPRTSVFQRTLLHSLPDLKLRSSISPLLWTSDIN